MWSLIVKNSLDLSLVAASANETPTENIRLVQTFDHVYFLMIIILAVVLTLVIRFVVKKRRKK